MPTPTHGTPEPTAPTPSPSADSEDPKKPKKPKIKIPVFPTGNARPTLPTSQTTAERALSFRVGSFNVLGSSHTINGARGMRSGPERAADAGRIIADRKLDVVGLQELQRNQVAPLLDTAGEFGIYPGLDGPRLGSQNSIVWRKSKWKLVAGVTNPIVYFRGRPMPMPVVLLRDRATGVSVLFMNFHNPATTNNHGDNAKWRTVATRQQISLVRQALAAGHHVVVTGDMNAKAGYYCQVVAAVPLRSSTGTHGPGPCQPPQPARIDWIMGGPTVQFGRHVTDESEFVRRTTDHPLMYVQARVKSRP
ncbi:MAG: endonuclease/exonuclease/phosphatase family protein [Nocardioidaceae bacterium]|nr:MAG: endonuclease/exonuclease/phosphatase family protein [Nocardioidaceae bacterium]